MGKELSIKGVIDTVFLREDTEGDPFRKSFTRVPSSIRIQQFPNDL